MNVLDAVRYILVHYPYKEELSKGRLNKLIYLSDWKSSIDYNIQITPIKWKFNHYGPYINEIEEKISVDNRITISRRLNPYGNEKHLVVLKSDANFKEPNNKERTILDFIIESTKNLYWNDFINAVYSTYPIKNSERGSDLDLIELAKEYKS